MKRRFLLLALLLLFTLGQANDTDIFPGRVDGPPCILHRTGSVECPAHETEGQRLMLKEGADDGTAIWILKVPDSGLTSAPSCTLSAAGRIPDDCVGDGTDASGAPIDADYLVGTANAGLSAEIVAGTSPGGELGGTWSSPTIDAGVIDLFGDVDGAENTNDLDEAAVEAELEGVLDLADLQGTLPAAKGGDAWTRLTVATDVSSSDSTVYVPVTALNWTATASTNYRMRCSLMVTAAITTTGLQLQWLGPASPTEVRLTRLNIQAGGISGLNLAAFHSSSTDDGAAASCGTTGCIEPIELVLFNGANAGTIALSIQTEVNTSSVTLHAGSWCEWMTF